MGESGIQVNPDKVQTIKNYPVPNTLKKVRGFLGICNYYRSFVRGSSSIARPLNKLLNKNAPFIWHDECQVAFNTLKNALMSPPILAFPDFDMPFQLSTDACINGLGC